MSDAGGQINQLGVQFQDKIAALYLGRMLDPRADQDPLDLQVMDIFRAGRQTFFLYSPSFKLFSCYTDFNSK